MTAVAHRWPLVFDRVSPTGHTLAHRLRYHWQSPRTACGVSVSPQTLGRRFDPHHPRACPECRALVLVVSRRVESWQRGTIPVPFRFTVWVEESTGYASPTARAFHMRPVTVWAWNHMRAGEKVRRREGIAAPLGWTWR